MDRTGKTHQLGEWQPRGVKGVLTTHVLGLVRAVKVTGEDTRLQVDGSLGREAQGNGLQLFSAGSQTEGEAGAALVSTHSRCPWGCHTENQPP